MSLKLIDWGEWVCGVIEWESKDHMEQAMSKLVGFMEQWRGPSENFTGISGYGSYKRDSFHRAMMDKGILKV